MGSREAQGQGIPGWVGIAVIVLVVAVAAFALFRMYKGDGPRDASTYPASAYRAPGYASQQKPADTPGAPAAPGAGGPNAGYGQTAPAGSR